MNEQLKGFRFGKNQSGISKYLGNYGQGQAFCNLRTGKREGK